MADISREGGNRIVADKGGRPRIEEFRQNRLMKSVSNDKMCGCDTRTTPTAHAHEECARIPPTPSAFYGPIYANAGSEVSVSVGNIRYRPSSRISRALNFGWRSRSMARNTISIAERTSGAAESCRKRATGSFGSGTPTCCTTSRPYWMRSAQPSRDARNDGDELKTRASPFVPRIGVRDSPGHFPRERGKWRSQRGPRLNNRHVGAIMQSSARPSAPSPFVLRTFPP